MLDRNDDLGLGCLSLLLRQVVPDTMVLQSRSCHDILLLLHVCLAHCSTNRAIALDCSPRAQIMDRRDD